MVESKLKEHRTESRFEIKHLPGNISLFVSNEKKPIAEVKYRRIAKKRNGNNQLIIDNFNVMEKYKRKGFGKRLMNEIIEILENEKREGILSVHLTNMTAIKFYKSLGWEEQDDEELDHKTTHRAQDMQQWMNYIPESLYQ
jgi:GNAT superfamily N-acetyltransferase